MEGIPQYPPNGMATRVALVARAGNMRDRIVAGIIAGLIYVVLLPYAEPIVGRIVIPGAIILATRCGILYCLILVIKHYSGSIRSALRKYADRILEGD